MCVCVRQSYRNCCIASFKFLCPSRVYNPADEGGGHGSAGTAILVKCVVKDVDGNQRRLLQISPASLCVLFTSKTLPFFGYTQHINYTPLAKLGWNRCEGESLTRAWHYPQSIAPQGICIGRHTCQAMHLGFVNFRREHCSTVITLPKATVKGMTWRRFEAEKSCRLRHGKFVLSLCLEPAAPEWVNRSVGLLHNVQTSQLVTARTFRPLLR